MPLGATYMKLCFHFRHIYNEKLVAHFRLKVCLHTVRCLCVLQDWCGHPVSSPSWVPSCFSWEDFVLVWAMFTAAEITLFWVQESFLYLQVQCMPVTLTFSQFYCFRRESLMSLQTQIIILAKHINVF